MLSSLRSLIGPVAVKSNQKVGQGDSRLLKKYVIEFSGSQIKFQAALEILNRKLREHYIEAVVTEFISSPIRITSGYIDIIILAKPDNPNGKIISIESWDDYAAYVQSEDHHKRFGQFETTSRLVKFHDEVQVRLIDELSVF
jgi:aspartate/methionine/tyrosine aminotransferase